MEKIRGQNRKVFRIVGRTSLRFRITSAMILLSLIPGIFLAFLYFRNIREFYKNKIEIHQLNTLNMMTSKMESIIEQGRFAMDQALGLAANSTLFEGYKDMSPYERLTLFRNVNSLLTNIRISNNSVDNIYMLNIDGNYYTSNREWNKEAFLKKSWIIDYDKRESEGIIIIPTHTAEYKYPSQKHGSPLVVSLVSYLNLNTDNSIIKLVQIDISYQKICEAMQYMKMTDQDTAFIVDNKGNIIYAPDENFIGKHSEEIMIDGKSLSDIVTKIVEQSQLIVNDFTIRKSPIKGSSWDIIQINSNQMLSQELNKFRSIWESTSIICMVVAVLMALSLSLRINKPISDLIKSMKKVSHGDFSTKVNSVSDKDLDELVNSFNFMVSEIEKLMKENIQKERERLIMELTALNSQINSHFLYNTLNAVKWMAVQKGANDIAKMIVSLVNMLEYSCKNIDAMVPITEEINFIKDYVYICEIRYKRHIRINIDLDTELNDCMILKMLLQPIVENAILHGFGDENTDNQVSIIGTLLQDSIKIQIKDNGKGFKFEGIDKLTGVGLHNIQKRIVLNYGEPYKLIIDSEIGKGTCVTLIIPAIKKVVVNEKTVDS